MPDEYEYVKVDIEMEVDYPASPGVEPPPTPSVAYVAYVIDTPGAKPGDDELYDGYEVTSVAASSREVVEWQGAHRRYRERVDTAHLVLQEAEKAWREAMRIWSVEISDAVAEYSPVQEELESRKAMVEAQDVLLEERARQGRMVVEVASLEAEDAVLGPRHWVLFHKTNHLGHRVGAHTLHTVDCHHVQNKPKDSVSQPMRQAEAKEAMRRNHLIKRCGKCLPDMHFKDLPKIPEQRQHPH